MPESRIKLRESVTSIVPKVGKSVYETLYGATKNFGWISPDNAFPEDQDVLFTAFQLAILTGGVLETTERTPSQLGHYLHVLSYPDEDTTRESRHLTTYINECGINPHRRLLAIAAWVRSYNTVHGHWLDISNDQVLSDLTYKAGKKVVNFTELRTYSPNLTRMLLERCENDTPNLRPLENLLRKYGPELTELEYEEVIRFYGLMLDITDPKSHKDLAQNIFTICCFVYGTASDFQLKPRHDFRFDWNRIFHPFYHVPSDKHDKPINVGDRLTR